MWRPKTKTIDDLYNDVSDVFFRSTDSTFGLSERERHIVDNLLRYDFNSFKIFDMFKSTEQLLDYLNTYCDSMKYKWSGLIASTEFDYDPIANVDGTETRTRLASDNFKDGLITTVLDGERNESSTQDTTQTIANRSNTHNDGKHTTTNKQSVINSDTMKKDSETVDEHNTNATDTIGGGTDTSKIDVGRKVEDDTLTTVTNRESENFKEVYERHGNIGLTSSQQLIEQERRVLDYNVLRVIAHDVALVICMP